MKTIAIALVCLLLGACQKAPEHTQEAGSSFNVERLFTVDDCTVYRFYDDRTVYFTNCKGSTKWEESHGKYSTDEQVEGGM